MAKVYFVGAGPGAADLITVRGATILAKAQIIFYDALVDTALLDYAPTAMHVFVGKRCGAHCAPQALINQHLVDASTRFETIVRLKGGDPAVFGRLNEEIAAITKHHIDYEIVPGVSSALAAAASLGVSLTERGVSRSLIFTTKAHGQADEQLHFRRPERDTRVYYMARKDLQEIARELLASGYPLATAACIVEDVSCPGERKTRLTLGELARKGCERPSTGALLLLIGDVFDQAAADFNDGALEDQMLPDRLTHTHL